MSTTPLLNGTADASVEELTALRARVTELELRLDSLETASRRGDWRQAIAGMQRAWERMDPQFQAESIETFDEVHRRLNAPAISD